MGVEGFWIERDGTFVTHLGSRERGVLMEVVDEVVVLLGGDRRAAGERPLQTMWLGAEQVATPTDPAVRRLLPDVSREDPAVAAEFRRLTEDDLRSTKVANLLRLRAALGAAEPDIALAASEAPAVAAALTDVRLVLAERLGVRTEADSQVLHRRLAEGDPDGAEPAEYARTFLAAVYEVFGLLQESLVGRMLEALPDDEDSGRGRPPR